jgi:hypothetical protein
MVVVPLDKLQDGIEAVNLNIYYSFDYKKC